MRHRQQPSVEYLYSLTISEVMILLISACRNDVRSSGRQLMKRCVRPTDSLGGSHRLALSKAPSPLRSAGALQIISPWKTPARYRPAHLSTCRTHFSSADESPRTSRESHGPCRTSL